VAKGAPQTHISYDGAAYGGRFHVDPDTRQAALHVPLAQDVTEGARAFLGEVVPPPSAPMRVKLDVDKLPAAVGTRELLRLIQRRAAEFWPAAPARALTACAEEPHVVSHGGGVGERAAFAPVEGLERRGMHVSLKVAAAVRHVHAFAYDLREWLPGQLGGQEVDVDLGIYNGGSLRMALCHGRAKDPCPRCVAPPDSAEAKGECAMHCTLYRGFCYKPHVYFPSVVLDGQGDDDALTLDHLKKDWAYLLQFTSLFSKHAPAYEFSPPADAFPVPAARQLREGSARQSIPQSKNTHGLEAFLRARDPRWSSAHKNHAACGGLAFNDPERLKSNRNIKVQVRDKDEWCKVCSCRHSNRIYFLVHPDGAAFQLCSKGKVEIGNIPAAMTDVFFPSKRFVGAPAAASRSDDFEASCTALVERLQSHASGAGGVAKKGPPPNKRARYQTRD